MSTPACRVRRIHRVLRAVVPAVLPVIAVLAQWTLAPSVALAKPEELDGSVRSSDRPEPRPTSVLRIDGVDYLDLQEISRVFHATKYWRAEIGKMVLKIDSKRVTLTVGSPFVFVDQAGANLLAPVIWHDGRLFAPVRLATHVLDPLVSERVSWSPERLELRVLLGDPNILNLSWDLRENGTLVQLRLGEPLNAKLLRAAADRILVRVPDGRLTDEFPRETKGVGLVDSVSVAEESEGAVFTFHLTDGAGPAELVARPSPPRLELSIRQAGDSGTDLPPAAFDSVAAFPEAREVRVVMLDPGHGGADRGVAPGKLAEKDLTLAIAKRTRERLLALGFEVYLTREDDRFVSADARARSANAIRADVFLSIHANGWFDPKRAGFVVGLLPAPDATASDPAELPHWGERNETTSRDSATLADIVAAQLDQATDRPNRGVHEESYAPLAGATMAAVLVEVGYLTNREDAHALADADHQEQIASALAESVKEFREALAGGSGNGAPVGDPQPREESGDGGEI